MSVCTVGILALQGAFTKHAEVLKALGGVPRLIRRGEELEGCDALIIPGGESTTISKRIDFIEMRGPLQDFIKRKPVFGTCAGLILMAEECGCPLIRPFRMLDVTVSRNGYGRQYDSFSTGVEVTLDGKAEQFHAVFIRAPRIISTGKDVQILARYKEEAILVQQGTYLGATFHPELSDPRIHSYFLRAVQKSLIG